jgi:nucleoside-diphosphate-sugar epimerase
MRTETLPRSQRQPIVTEDLAAIVGADLPWHDFAGKTVLVTGCNGFLPAYMVETLLHLNEIDPAQKTQVIGLARDRRRAAERFACYRDRADLHLLVQDVCAPLPADLSADYVIHAASPTSPKLYGSDPVGTLLPNVVGTYHLLELARRSRARGFLQFSSGAVYGELTPAGDHVTETEVGRVDPLAPGSCYAESKRMAETMCVSWWRQHRVPARIVRIGHTYGPGMRLDDGRVFADFVADVIACRPITLRSSGTAIRPFTYLADAVTGFFTVLLRGEPGQAYNVCNERETCTIRELAEVLAGLFPERGLSVRYAPRNGDEGYVTSSQKGFGANSTKARALGWNPLTGIRAGFRRTVLSFETSETSSKVDTR